MCSCSEEVLISGPNVHFDAWSDLINYYNTHSKIIWNRQLLFTIFGSQR
jgi:hypothetical protein